MHGSEWRTAPRTFCFMALVIGVAGCAEPGRYDQPGFPFLKSYAAAPQGNPVLLSNAAWWHRFKDPVLDALIQQALSGSLSLEAARERVTEANAALRQIPGAAALSPDASLKSVGANGNPARGVAEGNLAFTWLLDPLGGRREELNSAGARIEVAAAEVNAAQLLLLFNLANAYVDLRFQQRLLVLRYQDLASRRQTLALTQTFFDANSATRLDLVRAEAVLAEIEGQIPGLQAAIQAKKAEIAVLVGVAPGTLAINLDQGGGQPRARLSSEVGIPADLLRNRPDIFIAERLYYAAVADIGAARADLYPKLSLGGAISLRSIKGNSSTEYFFGPTLQFPSLLSKAPRAAVEAGESRARQAHTTWKATVLQAILEVESALVTYSASVSAVNSSEKTVRLYREVVDLTRDLIDKDGATLRDLVDAETSIAAANTTLAENLRQMGRNFVALNVNLGSGNAFSVASN